MVDWSERGSSPEMGLPEIPSKSLKRRFDSTMYFPREMSRFIPRSESGLEGGGGVQEAGKYMTSSHSVKSSNEGSRGSGKGIFQPERPIVTAVHTGRGRRGLGGKSAICRSFLEREYMLKREPNWRSRKP